MIFGKLLIEDDESPGKASDLPMIFPFLIFEFLTLVADETLENEGNELINVIAYDHI